MLDAKASSTGELVFRLMQDMRFKMSRDICTNLYAAIITDTGSFRYSSTTKETFMAAGVLVGEGRRPQRIAENIYESDSPARLKLMARALSTLSLDLESKVGSMVVTQKDLLERGAAWEHTEGFVDIPPHGEGYRSIGSLYPERGKKFQAEFAFQSQGRRGKSGQTVRRRRPYSCLVLLDGRRY
jgi:phosphoesterase RecJ-like protein